MDIYIRLGHCSLVLQCGDAVQDVVAALILSEAVYKVLDGSLEDAVEQTVQAFHDFPSELVQNLKLQWSLPHVSHRCKP